MKLTEPTIFILPFIITLFSTNAKAEDWPQWRGSNRDGISKEKDLLEEGQDALQNTTLAYGVANWNCYNGNKEKGSQLLKSILTSDYWPAFGYIAAEADVVDNRCR